MIDETAAEIRELRTHSSSAVAVKAARALESVTEREYTAVEEYLRTLERNSSALRRANPSHASLQTSQRGIVADVEDADPDTVEAAKERTREAIEDAIDTVETGKREAAANAAAELTDGTTLLTHDYSTTVLEAVERATDRGATLTCYVTEARPRFMGRRTARALASLGVDTCLIVDSAAGHYLDEIEAVVVGMDCIVDGTLYNPVGKRGDTGTPRGVRGREPRVRRHPDAVARPRDHRRGDPGVLRDAPALGSVQRE